MLVLSHNFARVFTYGRSKRKPVYVKLSVLQCPAKFAKHALSNTNVSSSRMKVWVLKCSDKKINLGETSILRYHKGDEYMRVLNQVSHHDVFLSFSACNKVCCFKIGFYYHYTTARETNLSLSWHRAGTDTVFSSEELSAFVRQITTRTPHYIEIACDCTNNRLGDFFGILRISDDGTICATCLCNQDCKRVFSCPAKFAKHASRCTNVTSWRKKVWVLNCNGGKIKMGETYLLRYYKGDEYVRPCNQVSHHDEFLNCSACNKVRRFELRSRDACRFYHDAAARQNRTCNDMIPGRWTCEDFVEKSLRSQSDCGKKINCKGCRYCLCFGCGMCRFEDCGCQVCTDFYANAPQIY